MLRQEPDDAFLRYALAMELEKAGEHEQSLAIFRALMADDPPHVASFLMAGQQLAAQDRVPEARQVLRDGIEAARRQGDHHAASEMGSLLTGLTDL
jgi:hypothetical protein